MVYTALVKRLDSQIEEEVTIEIEDIEFTGFAFICPYKIEVGKSYPVTMELLGMQREGRKYLTLLSTRNLSMFMTEQPKIERYMNLK